MSQPLKRYRVEREHGCEHCLVVINDPKDGEWVKAADVEAVERDLEHYKNLSGSFERALAAKDIQLAQAGAIIVARDTERVQLQQQLAAKEAVIQQLQARGKELEGKQ